MKKLSLILIIVLTALIAQAQVAKYGEVTKPEKFETYISKQGDTINVGDTLIIGRASGEFGFIYITQGGQRMHPSHSGKNAIITQIKAFGNKHTGYKVFLMFKGFGLVPVVLDYDNAIDTGEIINK